MTETDDLAEALDHAAQRWPDLSRPQVLVRLALEGHRAAQHQRDSDRQRKLAALDTHSGSLSGVYARNELASLRKDWPE